MSPQPSASGTPGSSATGGTASSTGHGAIASTSAQPERGTGSARAESPRYVTAADQPSIEEYERQFWQRQMARVEQQMMLPGLSSGDVNPVAAARATASLAAPAEGSADPTSIASTIPPGTSAKDLMEMFKPQAGQLPLARIKKVMKASDDDVKMISAEAPILFARACEIFIADLTCRSYMHATSQRRRTVQRSDVVAAVAGSNDFDFLVDIVPRAGGEQEQTGTASGGSTAAAGADVSAGSISEGESATAQDVIAATAQEMFDLPTGAQQGGPGA